MIISRKLSHYGRQKLKIIYINVSYYIKNEPDDNLFKYLEERKNHKIIYITIKMLKNLTHVQLKDFAVKKNNVMTCLLKKYEKNKNFS